MRSFGPQVHSRCVPTSISVARPTRSGNIKRSWYKASSWSGTEANSSTPVSETLPTRPDLRVAEHVGDWRHLCRLAARCTAGVLDHVCPLQRATAGQAAQRAHGGMPGRSISRDFSSTSERACPQAISRDRLLADFLPEPIHEQYIACRRAIPGQTLPAQIACWLLANQTRRRTAGCAAVPSTPLRQMCAAWKLACVWRWHPGHRAVCAP